VRAIQNRSDKAMLISTRLAHACKQPRWRWLGLVAVLICGIAPASAEAATMQLTVGADPVESVTTQLGATGSGASSSDSLYLNVKPAGGTACGANHSADDGSTVIYSYSIGSNPNYNQSRNWTFQAAGSYLLCGWLENGNTVNARASMPFTVRAPHITLSVSAPASATTGQTFQVSTTAQTETDRTVSTYAIPDTGNGCPANAAAASSASGSRTVIYEWDVVGGPLTRTENATYTNAGTYLYCAYVQYPRNDSPPEATASGKTSVVSPPQPCPATPVTDRPDCPPPPCPSTPSADRTDCWTPRCFQALGSVQKWTKRLNRALKAVTKTKRSVRHAHSRRKRRALKRKLRSKVKDLAKTGKSLQTADGLATGHCAPLH
jgi:hypothetical protein